MSLLSRLAKKIRKENGCWNWTAATDKDGYGRIRAEIKGHWTHNQAHRAMYELAFGEVPKGMHVLHTCDNPACVNPHHLYLGDHAQNMADKSKRRRIHGKLNPNYRHGRLCKD